MKLLTLETQGFKRLRNHTFNFSEGLNVIIGENAAGKSTLLQAIECALFGVGVVPGKKENIITWGQKTWKVVLSFTIANDIFTLTRSKTTAKLEKDSYDDPEAGPQLVANGATPVTKHVEELLGLSAKDYNLFMQSKQGETAGVLTFGAAALNRKVEEFSGISLIDDVISLAQEDFRQAKAQADALSFEKEEKTEAEGALAFQKAEVQYLGTQVEAAVQELEGAAKPESIIKPESDPDVMQEQREKVARLRQRFDQAKRDHINAQQRHEEAVSRFNELTKPADKTDLQVDLDAAVKAENTAREEAKRLEREMDRQVNLWHEMEAAQEKMSADRDEDVIGEELAKAVELQSEAAEELENIKGVSAVIAEKLTQLGNLKKDAKCPTCNTKLTDHDPERLAAEISELSAEQAGRKVEHNNLQRLLNDTNQRVDSLERELETVQANEKKYQDLYDELAALGINMETADSPIEVEMATANAAHSRAMNQRVGLEQKLEQSEAEWKRYTKAEREATNATQEVASAADAMDKARVAMEAALEQGEPSQELIAESRELWKEYHQLFSKAKLEYAEAQNAVTLAKQKFESAQRELSTCEKAVEEFTRRAEQIKEHNKTADQASRLAKFLRERRAGYLQEVWDAVLGVATRQIGQSTRGSITGLSFKDGEFLFEEEGVLAPITSASGAQKAYIGTAVRIGLSRALYGKDALLIFDEPTESMSEHNATGLSASLAGVASQCLLITHRAQDQDLAANLLEVA